jgi:hypothetical protein
MRWEIATTSSADAMPSVIFRIPKSPVMSNQNSSMVADMLRACMVWILLFGDGPYSKDVTMKPYSQIPNHAVRL